MIVSEVGDGKHNAYNVDRQEAEFTNTWCGLNSLSAASTGANTWCGLNNPSAASTGANTIRAFQQEHMFVEECSKRVLVGGRAQLF
jgi:hypothetical protein